MNAQAYTLILDHDSFQLSLLEFAFSLDDREEFFDRPSGTVVVDNRQLLVNGFERLGCV